MYEIEPYLIEHGIKYESSPGQINFLNRKEIKTTIAYLKLLNRIFKDSDFEDVLLTQKGFNDANVKVIQDYAKRQNISLFDACKSFKMSYD